MNHPPKIIACLLALCLLAAPSLSAGYYHTQGNQIVDENGTPATFNGIAWFGFETANYCPHGLWSRSMNTFLDQMQSLGYNLLRIPFCNEMFNPGVMPNSINFYENPDLQGLTPIQLLDELIQRAGQRGMKVMLDRHRPTSSSQSELWYVASVSEQRWIDDWKMLAQRYAGNDTVIAADLHNEPHGPATWGSGIIATDWRLAAERCGNAILSIHTNWLIVVEGIEHYQGDFYWWGGNLKGAGEYPVRLSVPNRLVYSPHDYGPGVYPQTWFSHPSFPSNMAGIYYTHWAYLHIQNIAPILVGEFGGKSVDTTSIEGKWQNYLVDYIATNHMYWTYWCWNPNSGDTGGVLNDDWTTINQAKQAMLNRLINATPPPPPTPPEPPANPAATPLSSTQIRLAWTDASNNEDSFLIERSNNGIDFTELAALDPNTSSWTNTGLNSQTLYYYRIRAVNAIGASPFSTTVTATTFPPPPPAPANLTAAPLSTGVIMLDWTDNSADETGFKVESSTDGANFSLVATLSSNVTRYTNSGLAAATTYFYRVRAFNTNGESPNTPVQTATTFAPPLDAPAYLTLAIVSPTQIDLAWLDSITNETGFNIERSTDGTTFTPIAVRSPDINRYPDLNLSPATTYYYRIRAFNDEGESLYSNVARGSTLPALNPITVLATADFESNASGLLNGQGGGNGWSANWSVNVDTGKVAVIQPPQTLTRQTADGGVRALKLERSMYNDSVVTRPINTPHNGDDVYVSFLYRRTGGGPDDSLALWLGNKSGPAVGIDNDRFTIRTAEGIATNSTFTLQPNSNYLVVAHFFKTSPGTASLYNGAELWVNPDSTSLTPPLARVTGQSAGSIAVFQTLGFRVSGTEENDTNQFDRIVAGTRWADVVPGSILAAANFEDNTTAGLNSQRGGQGWATAWTVNIDLTKVNVIAPALPLNAAGISGGSQTLEIKRSMYNDLLLRRDLIAATTSDHIYISFLYRKTAGALDDSALFWFNNKSGPAIGISHDKFQIRTAEGISSASTTTLQSGIDYFVVGRFSKSLPGPDNPYDLAQLWINPATALDDPETVAAGSNTNSLSGFSTVGLKVIGTLEDDICLFDRLLVGTQWSDVAPPIAPYQQWQLTRFTTEELIDPAVSGELADPDLDGVQNLMEYALNLDPKNAASALPNPTIENGRLTLRYQRSITATDVSCHAAVSSDLLTWTESGLLTEIIDNGDGTQTVTISNAVADSAARFIRLTAIAAWE